jgi:hypothetical protein
MMVEGRGVNFCILQSNITQDILIASTHIKTPPTATPPHPNVIFRPHNARPPRPLEGPPPPTLHPPQSKTQKPSPPYCPFILPLQVPKFPDVSTVAKDDFLSAFRRVAGDAQGGGGYGCGRECGDWCRASSKYCNTLHKWFTSGNWF